jgi:HlyD family secretion protein
MRKHVTQHVLRSTGLFLTWLLMACQSNAGLANELRLPGVIEAKQVDIVAEVTARVASVTVDEGDNVEANQVVVALDDATLASQVKQAQASVAAAEANLAQVKAGTRPEAIAAAVAAVAEAQANRDGAALAISDTLSLRDNPQELVAQLDAAQAGVKLAGQNVAVMQTNLAEARYKREFYADQGSDKRDDLDKQIGIAQKNLEAAQAQLDGAKAQVAALEALRAAPITLQTQVNSARSAYSLTLASEQVAQAALAELKTEPAVEDVALAEAKLHQAQAQLKLAQAYLARATIRTPLAGFVSQRSTQAGEVVQPGGALLSISNLDDVKMIVYVPQSQLPRLHVGDPVAVFVDAYPGETFDGQIKSIAQQAQFSSLGTQSKEDRADIVFAVKIQLSNGNRRLRAGMTADAVLKLQ